MKPESELPPMRSCWYWVLFRGCVLWGVPCILLLAALRYASGQTSFMAGVIDALPVGIVGGILYGMGAYGYKSHQAFKQKMKLRKNQNGK
jgi:hypothetical protein